MEYIVIKKPNNEVRARIFGSSTPIKITKGEQRKQLLGENIVELSIESVKPIDFGINDYLDVFGERYWLNLLPKAKKTKEDLFSYDLTFESAQYNMAKVVFLDMDKSGRSSSSTFSIRGSILDVAEIVINNMNRVFGAGIWKIGAKPNQTTDIRDYSFSDNNCLNVLQSTCNDHGLEFEVVPDPTGFVINIAKLGSVIPYTLQYGRGKGLYSLLRQNASSSNIVTRLFAYGSTKNLPLNYRNYSERLRLAVNAESYIDNAKAVAAFGIIEGSKTFDDIYPHRTGEVTGIVSGDVLSFVDTTMNFDLNEKNSDGSTKYLIPDLSAKITFNSGGLSGYTFELSKYDHATKTFKILAYTDQRNMVFPSETAPTFQIKPGDQYVITDVYPRQVDTDKAEADLLEKATEYLSQNCAPRVKYEATISEDYLAEIAGSAETVVNLFNLGDSIGIIDEDIQVNRTGEEAIRITEFTRSLTAKSPYSYKFTISDTVEIKLIDRIISDQKDIDTIIKINQLTDVSKMQRSWRTTQELLSMVFDQEGYFKDGNIKPNSIETQMLSVGAKAQQMILKDVVIEPNLNGASNSIKVTGGSLVHYGLFDTPKTWNITSRTSTLSGSTAMYIYCRCRKADNVAEIIFSGDQKSVEDTTYYYFILGVLHAIDSATNTRWISLTYGASSINGRFIKTGRIVSADGKTWFDLDNGEISGRIKFISADGSIKDVSEVNNAAQETKDYINNTLPGILNEIQAQLDGQIEQFFETYDPTTTNAPANGWTTTQMKEDHLGDLFYNTASGKVFRWVKANGVYNWQQLQDSEVAQALALANDALALAKTKRRIFTAQPYTPYEIGDLWVQGTKGDIMKCKTTRATGNFAASDWEKASDYTNDDALNGFINGSFSNTVTDLTNQIDGKIESWFQDSDPASAWGTAEIRAKHTGDMWYSSAKKILRRYNGSSWVVIEDQKAIDAYDAASKAQDTADGKRRVFLSQPYTPYDAGDLWTDGKDLKRCITGRANGSYVASDWGAATHYDNTQTVIDGGVVTSGTVQLAGKGGSILAGITGEGTASTSVRFWAGATFDSRSVAPFRVTQAGEVFARHRIELQDSANNGLAGICGQGTDGTDTGIRFWAGAAYGNRTTAPFRVDKNGACVMSKATINNGCTIGSWEVSNGGIFNDSGEAYIIARKSFGGGRYCEARIGSNVFPSSTGSRGAGYFENTESNSWGINYAAYFYAANGRSNFAIYSKGTLGSFGSFLNIETGYMGTAYSNTLQSNFFKNQTFVFSYVTGSFTNVYLPGRAEIRSEYGSDAVTFELTIVLTYECGDRRIRLTGVSDGVLVDNNANRPNGGNGYLDMGRGDVMRLRYYNGHYYLLQYRT